MPHPSLALTPLVGTVRLDSQVSTLGRLPQDFRTEEATMAQQLKRWESPRRSGRNDKGQGGSARQRQLRKRNQGLRNRLRQGSYPTTEREHSPLDHNLPVEEGQGSPFFMVLGGLMGFGSSIVTDCGP